MKKENQLETTVVFVGQEHTWRSLARWLRECDCKVRWTDNGQQAIEVIRRISPSLVVCEVSGEGIELLRCVRSYRPALPVVMTVRRCGDAAATPAQIEQLVQAKRGGAAVVMIHKAFETVCRVLNMPETSPAGMVYRGQARSQLPISNAQGSSAPEDALNPERFKREFPRRHGYRLLRVIGKGGFGEVWLAEDVLGNLCAVKIVYRLPGGETSAYERELAALTKYIHVCGGHPNLVLIRHVGKDPQGRYLFYVMELAANQLPGADPRTSFQPLTLASRITARGRLPFDECVRIALTILDALRYLHGRGLIHADIKPSNIIFVRNCDGDEVLQLADPGLVTVVGRHPGGRTLGFAPLQGLGLPQADIYALGKLLYVMFTGRDPRRFPEIPPELAGLVGLEKYRRLAAVIFKACEEDAQKRYLSLEEMKEDLIALQQLP